MHVYTNYFRSLNIAYLVSRVYVMLLPSATIPGWRWSSGVMPRLGVESRLYARGGMYNRWGPAPVMQPHTCRRREIQRTAVVGPTEDPSTFSHTYYCRKLSTSNNCDTLDGNVYISNSYTLNPNTRAIRVWEVVGVVMALVSVISVSTQAAFLHGQGWLWAINYTADLYFITDM